MLFWCTAISVWYRGKIAHETVQQYMQKKRFGHFNDKGRLSESVRKTPKSILYLWNEISQQTVLACSIYLTLFSLPPTLSKKKKILYCIFILSKHACMQLKMRRFEA